jgi:cellulose synthase/poly-beta-1,6-N-acetylglucosamine synthase-like glycosyltransferase
MSTEGFAPSCSVVVCTRLRPAQLDECLAAVSRQCHPGFDVLVVDNTPGDARTRQVALRWGARYEVEPTPGLSRARNLAARLSWSEVIAYLDDDSIPEPAWLAKIAAEFADPAVMAAVGRVLPTAGRTAVDELFARTGTDGGDERRVIDRENPAWFEIANFGGLGIGANMALRRSAFSFWPGFDVRLGRGAPLHGAEEHYAFFSLIERGYRVAYTPHAVVHHPYPGTMAELRTRHLSDFAAVAAYLAFLLAEQPSHRRRTLKYILEGLVGRPRPLRTAAGLRGVSETRLRIAPRWREAAAGVAGLVMYARSRFTAKRAPEVIQEPEPARLSAVPEKARSVGSGAPR